MSKARELANQHGFTLTEIADAIGVDSATLIRHGRTAPLYVLAAVEFVERLTGTREPIVMDRPQIKGYRGFTLVRQGRYRDNNYNIYKNGMALDTKKMSYSEAKQAVDSRF